MCEQASIIANIIYVNKTWRERVKEKKLQANFHWNFQKGNQTPILPLNNTNDQQLNGIIQQKRKALRYI